jgi:hypothetical protein
MIVVDNSSALFGQTVGYIIQQVNSLPLHLYIPLLLSSLTIPKGFWKFDETGSVIAYDLTLPSFGDTLDIILGNQSDPLVQAQYIQLICGRAQVQFFLFFYYYKKLTVNYYLRLNALEATNNGPISPLASRIYLPVTTERLRTRGAILWCAVSSM